MFVAGCGGRGYDAMWAARSEVNGLWTGTVGYFAVNAVFFEGMFFAFSDNDGNQETILFLGGEYRASANKASLSSDGIKRANLSVGTEPATAALRVRLSGEGVFRTMTGTLGSEALRLVFADNNRNATDLSLLAATWSDADTWSSEHSGGATTLTIDANGALAGRTAGIGCTYAGQVVVLGGINLYVAAVAATSCDDAAANGGYLGYVFPSAGAGGPNDVLNLTVFNGATGASGLLVLERRRPLDGAH